MLLFDKKTDLFGIMDGRPLQSFILILFFLSQFAFVNKAQAWMPTATLTQKRLTLIAGNPGVEAGVAGVDGTGTEARFYYPSGLAFDSHGNLFVVDNYSSTVRKITPSGVVTTVAGGNGTTGTTNGTGWGARFNFPNGVVVDSSDNVFIADTNNYLIRKITPAGVVTTFAGTAGVSGSADGTGTSARFNNPFGLAIDSSNTLYVADSNNHMIRKITSSGVVTTLAGAGTFGSADGTGAAAKFAYPRFLAFDSGGNLFVSDESNSSIRKITSTGVVTTFAGSSGLTGSADGTGASARFYYPRGMVIDSSDNLYISEYANNHTIRKITSSGVVTTFAGSAQSAGYKDGTGTAARFYSPGGLALDSSGNLFVAEYYAGLIRKITSTAVVTTFAGAGTIQATTDGTGTGARFYTPVGMVIDSSDNVFVSDNLAHTIRKITPSGVVTTFAGGAGHSGSNDGTGTGANFNNPTSIVKDSSGNFFLADSNNHMIRKITSSGVVTTLAGAGVSGSADGTGSGARFNNPQGLAIDGNDNLYVADTNAHTIRKVTPAGVVTTLAGKYLTTGSADATGGSARFYYPAGITFDSSSGNLFIADKSNSSIRQMTLGGVVTTFAGLSQSSGSVDGTGTAARFNNPYGMYADGSGNIYVGDSGNHLLRKINSGGVVTTLVGTAYAARADDGNGTAAGFHGGVGAMAFDSNGNLFVNDTGGSVRKMTPAGDVTTFAGYKYQYDGAKDGVGTNVRFSAPKGLVVDASGNIFVADSTNATIRKINPAGVVSTFAGLVGAVSSLDGTGASARFTGPIAMTKDSGGNIFVIDGASAIRKITPAGVVTTFAGKAGSNGSADGTGATARFTYPQGIAVDSSDNLYVADTGNSSIRMITAGGVVTTLAGKSGSSGSADGTGAAARFNNPVGITVDSNGNIFVADSTNRTIRKVTQAGVVTTFAGSQTLEGFLDGTGSSARFSASLVGLTIDKGNNLYLADSMNGAIRKITPGAVVTTVIGGTSAKLSLQALPAAVYHPSYLYTTGGKLYITTEDTVVVTPNP